MQALTDSGTEFFSFDCGDVPAVVHISRFAGCSGVDEIHLMVRPTQYGSIESQLDWVACAYSKALCFMEVNMGSAVFRRFFCSDLLNQASILEQHLITRSDNTDTPCAISMVDQPPTPPVKVAMWAYHIVDAENGLEKVREGKSVTLRRGELSHHWSTGLTSTEDPGSYEQTHKIFAGYDEFLRARGMTMADNLLRTWLFVQHVDSNYEGLVVARRELFAEEGLTADTHYIASTGIEGGSTDVAAKVMMDAYAISGVRQEQVTYLSALDHLSPTHVYGVTFERATSVTYRDRKHILISGTASIDRAGQILHPGNVLKQLERTLENVEALLKQADAGLKDMGVFLVYVRDASDHALVWDYMRERFGNAPIEVVVAAVCRPGWLIEIEGVATVNVSAPELPAF